MADEKDGKKVVKLPDAKGQKKPVTIGDLLESKAVVARMQQIVPQYANPEQLLRLCLLATHQRPLLRDCNAMTLLGAMMSCASLGFAPNTSQGYAYLIPFRNRQTGTVDVQLIIGYKGFVDLMWRSGNLSSLHADVVFKGDEFDYEYGSKMHLRHRPRGGGHEGRDPTDAYAYVMLKNGEAFDVMPYPDVLRIRNRSEGYKSGRSPWLTDEHEMAKKTAIRRLVKVIQISDNVSRAATLDQRSERQKVDFTAVAEDPEMIGFDGGSQEDDDDASGDMEGGDDAGHGQEGKVAPATDDSAAKTEARGAPAKAPRENKPQARRSFFGDDA